MDNSEGPVRTTKVFAHSRTTFPGVKEPLDVADVVEFCRDSKLPGRVVVSFPGNGGVASVVFEGKEQEAEVEEEKVDNPDQ